MKNVIIIYGAGGVGKSALARYILNAVSQSQMDFLTGFMDAKFADNFGFQLKALAHQLSNFSDTLFSSSASLKIGELERLNLLIEHIKNVKTLLLIDNMEVLLDENGKIAHPMFEQLVSQALYNLHNGSVVVLLSRMRLSQLYFIEETFFSHEIKGWDVNFVYSDYLPYLLYLHTSLNDMINTDEEKRQLLEMFQGNPLALKIANQLCINYNISTISSFIRDQADPAQALIKHLSLELSELQSEALYRFAQFSRSLSNSEILQFICNEDILNSLLIRSLVEPIKIDSTQYQIHTFTALQFNLSTDLEKRKNIVQNLVDKILDATELKPDLIYNHGLLRQAINMSMTIKDFEQAGQIFQKIGTRALSLGDVDYTRDIFEQLKGYTSELLSIRLLKILGHIYDFNDRLDLAEKTYQIMLEQSIKVDDAWSKSAALNGLGSIARFTGRLSDAISLYTESLQIRLDHGLIIEQSNSYHNLGAVYIDMQDIENSIKCLEKACDIRYKAKDPIQDQPNNTKLPVLCRTCKRKLL